MTKLAEYARIAQAMSGYAPQALPEGHPSTMLRDLRDSIPANPDALLSLLNMVRGGIDSAANWLEGPEAVTPRDMLNPAGLGTAGTGVVNALTRPSRDFRIADELMRRGPNEPSVGGQLLTDVIRSRSAPAGSAHMQLPRSMWARNTNTHGPYLRSEAAPPIGLGEPDDARQRVLDAMLARGEF